MERGLLEGFEYLIEQKGYAGRFCDLLDGCGAE